LIDRGHTLEQLTPLIIQAAADLDNKTWQPNNTSSCTQNTLFIHWQHIAISRPKNLRDILTKTAILNTNNINIPEIIHDNPQSSNIYISINTEIIRGKLKAAFF
jgi:hypothetical protein